MGSDEQAVIAVHDLQFFRSNLDAVAERLATRGFKLDVEQFARSTPSAAPR